MAAATGTKRILIAEDDITTGKMLCDFLKSTGFTVEIAFNGNEALKKYQDDSFQVVIVDIGMPVMDGNELIGHLTSFEQPSDHYRYHQ